MIAMCRDSMLWFKPRRELTEEQLEKRINNLHTAKSGLYTVITVVLTILLVAQVVQCIIKYVNEPTYMSNKIVKQYDVEFPSISVCPWDPYYKEDVIRDQYNLSSPSDYNKLTESNDKLIWQDRHGQDIFENITFKLDDLISGAYLRFLQVSNDSQSMGIHLKASDLIYKEKRHRKFGKCFSLQLTNHTNGGGIYYAKLKLKKNVKMYAHAKDQFLDLSGRMGYELKLGETTKFQVNYQIFQALSNVKGRINCDSGPYDDCMYNSMKDLMLKKHGCISPWIPHTNDSDKTCSNEPDKRGAFKINYHRLNDCLDPCHYMIVNAGGKTIIPTKEDSTYVYLYFAHRVPMSQEYFLYDFLSLLAEIGGYCGLFLGYSAFHLAIFIGKLFNTAIKDYEKRFKKKESTKQQNIPM